MTINNIIGEKIIDLYIYENHEKLLLEVITDKRIIKFYKSEYSKTQFTGNREDLRKLIGETVLDVKCEDIKDRDCTWISYDIITNKVNVSLTFFVEPIPLESNFEFNEVNIK